jgi:hypothetical protein
MSRTGEITMPEDAGAASATDGASQDAQPQGQGPGGAGGNDSTTPAVVGGAGSHSAAPGEDRSAEAMLADAVGSGDGQDGAGDDPAAQLKKVQADYARLQRQSRTWETRAKENAAKAKDFDAYTESQKTEQQKLADAAAAAEERATRAEQRYLRTMAAAEHDLPVSLIDRLAGVTEEEINASAEQLAAAINERAAVLAAAQAQVAGNGQQQGQPRNGTTGYRPVESMRPGALPASDNKPANPNTWLRDQLAAKRAQ